MDNENSYIYVRNHLGQWFYIPESEEDNFSLLLEDYILTGKSANFLKEFKDYRITSREEHKKAHGINRNQ